MTTEKKGLNAKKREKNLNTNKTIANKCELDEHVAFCKSRAKERQKNGERIREWVNETREKAKVKETYNQSQ